MPLRVELGPRELAETEATVVRRARGSKETLPLDGLAGVLRQMLDDDQDEPDGVEGTTMRLNDPQGGVLILERATLAFTPAEFARARALRDLAPPPSLVGLISHYWARLQQQAASERVVDQPQDDNPESSH